MPVITLQPESTVAAEFGGIGVVGHATAHQALSDASDSSYVVLQLTAFETLKWWRGGLPNLPDGAGMVVGVVVHARASKEDPPGAEVGWLRIGEFPNARINNLMDTGVELPTNFDSANITDLDVAEVNAAQWMAGGEWGTGAVLELRIYELSLEVDFNFVIGGSVAMIFNLLGPLVAVGLGEMPRLGLELLRRHRVQLSPAELYRAWLELRQARHRRYVFLG